MWINRVSTKQTSYTIEYFKAKPSHVFIGQRVVNSILQEWYFFNKIQDKTKYDGIEKYKEESN